MKSALEKRLEKLEGARREEFDNRQIEIYYIPSDCQDISAFENECTAKTPKNRKPLFIQFVSARNDEELGTGPLIDDGENDDD